MTGLEDDIARVARLRGRPVDQVLDATALLKEQQKRDATAPGRIAYMFSIPGKDDLGDFDRLPPASKAFIHELLAPPSASLWRIMLAGAHHDEEAVIQAVRAWVAENVPYDTRRAYGPTHPQSVRTR